MRGGHRCTTENVHRLVVKNTAGDNANTRSEDVNFLAKEAVSIGVNGVNQG